MPQISPRQAKLTIMVIRLELLLLLIMPLLAALMARGYGVIGCPRNLVISTACGGRVGRGTESYTRPMPFPRGVL